MIIQEFNINLIPEGLPPHVSVSQGDVGSRKIIAHVFDGEKRFHMDDTYTVVVKGTKPNKKGFRVVADVVDGAVQFDLDKIMTTHHGNVRCSIEISKDDEVINTLVFYLRVVESALAEDTEMDVEEAQDGGEDTEQSEP